MSNAHWTLKLFCSAALVLFFCGGAPAALSNASGGAIGVLLVVGTLAAAAFWACGGWREF